jgi:hypothetical protein
MKKIMQLLCFVALLTTSVVSHAQGQLTPGVQTSSLDSSISNWVHSSSDMNKSFYAVTYWVSGDDCGNYLKIYNANSFAPTSGQVLISLHHAFTRVRIDNDNNIYVLYTDRTFAGSTSYKTYIKKYNSSGTQIGSRVQVTSSTLASDIEVATNGDVLVGCMEGFNARVKVFRNMLYKGYLPLENINTSYPFALQMDMKGDKFVVGYSTKIGTSAQLKIKRFNYVPAFLFGSNLNLSSLHSNYSETGKHFIVTNNQIALRDNWDVFYVSKEGITSAIYKTKKLTTGSLSVFDTGNAKVDVDISNRLIISKNYGSVGSENNKVKLFSGADTLIHEYDLSSKIKNDFESLAIYDCEFLVTGIDRKLGGNPLSYTYESFHQLFNCQDCRPNMGATAVAKFRYPYQVNQVPSKYGPLDVTELCLVDKLLVDGSLSSCETGYFVGLSEFNPATWTDTLLLHSDWVTPLTQAPNNINIVSFLPLGYHLKPGKIYRFRLAVGSPWDAVDIFFEVSCCKRRIIVLEGEHQEVELNIPKGNVTDETPQNDLEILAYPNPSKKEITLDFSVFNSKNDIVISITNLQGRELYQGSTDKSKTTINISDWPIGIYFTKAIIDGKTYSKKIIKK